MLNYTWFYCTLTLSFRPLQSWIVRELLTEKLVTAAPTFLKIKKKLFPTIVLRLFPFTPIIYVLWPLLGDVSFSDTTTKTKKLFDRSRWSKQVNEKRFQKTLILLVLTILESFPNRFSNLWFHIHHWMKTLFFGYNVKVSSWHKCTLLRRELKQWHHGEMTAVRIVKFIAGSLKHTLKKYPNFFLHLMFYSFEGSKAIFMSQSLQQGYWGQWTRALCSTVWTQWVVQTNSVQLGIRRMLVRW